MEASCGIHGIGFTSIYNKSHQITPDYIKFTSENTRFTSIYTNWYQKTSDSHQITSDWHRFTSICVRVLVRQEDTPSCSTRRHVFCRTGKHVCLLNKRTCLLVQQEDASLCWAGVFLLNKNTCLSFEQEDMSSCWTGRQEDISSWWTRTLVFQMIPNKKTCLLVEQEDVSSCRTRWHVLLFNTEDVFLFDKTTCQIRSDLIRSL